MIKTSLSKMDFMPQLKGSISNHLSWLCFLFICFKIFIMYVDDLFAHMHTREHLI